jgi:hypothetical protein
VSLAGTLAGLAAASGVAAAGLWGAGRPGFGILPSGAGALVVCVAAAALAGTLESLLSGAEAPLGHHARNVLNTAAGAGLALVLVEA